MAEWYPEVDLVVQHAKIYTVAVTCDEIRQGKRDFPIIEDGGVAAKDGERLLRLARLETLSALWARTLERLTLGEAFCSRVLWKAICIALGRETI